MPADFLEDKPKRAKSDARRPFPYPCSQITAANTAASKTTRIAR